MTASDEELGQWVCWRMHNAGHVREVIDHYHNGMQPLVAHLLGQQRYFRVTCNDLPHLGLIPATEEGLLLALVYLEHSIGVLFDWIPLVI
jgi:hypothetical protein